MKQNKNRTNRRLEKKIEHISLGEFLSAYIIEGFCKIFRDLSVQREGVWDRVKKMDFISSVVKGNGDNNMLHYVDLEKCRAKAEKNGALSYMKHLAEFISQGAVLCHLDGGNRTDSIVEFLTNQIPLRADEYFFGMDDDGNALYFVLETDTFFKDLTDEQKELVLNMGKLVTVIYGDLTQEERAELFQTLNNGVDLNGAELRNAETSIISKRIRELNYEYKDLFILVGALSEKKAARWMFCEYIAKLMSSANLYMSENKLSWVSSKQIDQDYVSGSNADVKFPTSLSFFKKYVSYIELIPKMVNLSNDKKPELYYSAAYQDLYLLLTYMQKNKIELYESNSKAKKEFLLDFNVEIIKYMKDMETDYYIKTTMGVKRYEKYAGIIGKTSDQAVSDRVNKLIKEFIPKQLKKKKLVKVTKRKTSYAETKQIKAELFVKQEGKTASTNDKLNPFTLNKGAHVDHVKPVRKGGSDTRNNKVLESAEFNLKKGAKEAVNP